MGLAAASLTIRKDGAVVTGHDTLHKGKRTFIVYLSLRALDIVDVVKSKDSIRISIFLSILDNYLLKLVIDGHTFFATVTSFFRVHWSATDLNLNTFCVFIAVSWLLHYWLIINSKK